MTDDLEHQKLDDLTARIKQAEAKPAVAPEMDENKTIKTSRIGFDFMGAVFGGALLGWLADKAFPEITPWGLIGLTVVGFFGGVWNVGRALMSGKDE